MRLVIETALTACSAALLDGGHVVAERHEELGRGHAERLVPMIAELLAEAGVTRADAILVDVGPGSFTGLRVGVAAARAFGLAWGAPVAGTTSTALVAAAAFAADPALASLYVALDAGRGQVYAQGFERKGPVDEMVAIDPADAARASKGFAAIAGSGLALMRGLTGIPPEVGQRLPRAADARLLPEGASRPPTPLYVRAPDAVPAA